jgi:hypothetical protein
MVVIATTMGRYSWPDHCPVRASGRGRKLAFLTRVERGVRNARGVVQPSVQRRDPLKRVELLNARGLGKFATERKPLTTSSRPLAKSCGALSA